MTEYKENTVGWHLSRLKEPLRSRAMAVLSDHRVSQMAESMSHAIYMAFVWESTDERNAFWAGAYRYFRGNPRDCSDICSDDPMFVTGWDMAKECAPDPEVVNPPIEEKAPYGSYLNHMGSIRLGDADKHSFQIPYETSEGRHDRELKELQYAQDLSIAKIGKQSLQIAALEDQILRLVQHYKEHTHDERYMGHADCFEL